MGIFDRFKRATVIDNTSADDNVIANKSGVHVTVAGHEVFGSFTIDLAHGQSKRVTFGVEVNVYPAGQHSYDDLKYRLGRGEQWEIRKEQAALVMVRVAGGSVSNDVERLIADLNDRRQAVRDSAADKLRQLRREHRANAAIVTSITSALAKYTKREVAERHLG